MHVGAQLKSTGSVAPGLLQSARYRCLQLPKAPRALGCSTAVPIPAQFQPQCLVSLREQICTQRSLMEQQALRCCQLLPGHLPSPCYTLFQSVLVGSNARKAQLEASNPALSHCPSQPAQLCSRQGSRSTEVLGRRLAAEAFSGTSVTDSEFANPGTWVSATEWFWAF